VLLCDVSVRVGGVEGGRVLERSLFWDGTEGCGLIAMIMVVTSVLFEFVLAQTCLAWPLCSGAVARLVLGHL
jgi:hypothetical protein